MRFTRDDGETWEPCYLVIRQQFSAIEPTLFFEDGRAGVLSAALAVSDLSGPKGDVPRDP
jgi:hypothetical protein